jgi:hypothetical protein
MSILAVALAVSLGGTPAAPGKTAFEQVKKLEGNWQAGGKETKAYLSFRVVAGGTAVLETVTGADRTSITEMATFHLDGAELVMTSFTAEGVVHLKVAAASPRTVRFEAPKKAGGRAVALLFKDNDNLTREVAPGGGKPKASADFKREYVDTLK